MSNKKQMIMENKKYKMKITAREIGGWRSTNINLLVNKNVRDIVLAWKGDSDVASYLLEYYDYTKGYFSRSQYYKIKDFLNVAYDTIFNYKLIIEIE